MGATAGGLGAVSATAAQLDAIIFGGGIAGLWTLARLSGEGYRCLLLTDAALGAGQTIASQGIIHGGIKYTLGLAEPGEASRRIAEMPEAWRACLEGRGEVDLCRARVLSPCQYLWTTPGLVSRIAGLGASRVIRTAVARLGPSERPPMFAGAPRGVDVYRVDEPVLAIDSVVRALAEPLADRIARVDGGVRVEVDPASGMAVVVATSGGGGEGGGEPVRLSAKRVVFTAGAGNESLIERFWPGARPPTQRRPLHMAVVRMSGAPALFGHCIGPSSVPRLTIGASPSARAGPVWYIGGQIAETGVERTEPEQIAFARDELRVCVPWADLSQAEVETFRIDRAEGLPPGAPTGKRPDGPVVVGSGAFIAAWPTKLAFAPALASDILARCRESGITPGRTDALPALTHPGYAEYPWDLGAHGTGGH